MKIQKNNTGILITKTAKQPSAKIEFSLDELDALSEFCERLQDEKDIREYLNTAVTIPDSAEVSAPIAVKYLHDAALFEQLMDETRRNQEENQSNFLTAVSDAVSSIEKSRDVKEWHGLTKETAERFAREFMAERNPGRWSGFGEVPESVSLDPLNFPINDIYPKGNKPALRMQLISVTYPSLHRVCECSIIEDGVDLWARRTLDSMTAGTVEDLVETVLYVARMYERSKCFERIFVNHIQMEKSVYDALIRHLNDPDSINDEYRISDVVFAADNTIVSVLWEGNSKDGVSGMATACRERQDGIQDKEHQGILQPLGHPIQRCRIPCSCRCTSRTNHLGRNSVHQQIVLQETRKVSLRRGSPRFWLFTERDCEIF